jgi:uncharacterized protein YjiS (DUF1127 family)
MAAAQHEPCCDAAWNPIYMVTWASLAACRTPERNITMLVAILNFLRSWRRYNACLNELHQLGDRELADIGITRSDIPRVAWENANR